ncbi:MAG: hypothetical protein ACK4TA_19425 [Saprospiraceae bacterium]
MNNRVDSLVEIFGNDTLVLDKIQNYPKKVVILIDHKCVSSTEQFLLSAIQSEKVTLMGQASGGVLDYSNMREASLGNSIFTLFHATSRSRRIDVGKGIDNVGLDYKQDWIL